MFCVNKKTSICFRGLFKDNVSQIWTRNQRSSYNTRFIKKSLCKTPLLYITPMHTHACLTPYYIPPHACPPPYSTLPHAYPPHYSIPPHACPTPYSIPPHACHPPILSHLMHALPTILFHPMHAPLILSHPMNALSQPTHATPVFYSILSHACSPNSLI